MSSTTRIFVRPAHWLGRVLWKTGDGRIIDGLGPDGIAARVIDITNRVVRLQTGYIYHYAFAMLVGVAALITWFIFAMGGMRPMSYGWPILSTVTFLPLLGALLIALVRGQDESAFRNARYIALWTTLIDLRGCRWSCGATSIPTTAQFQFVEIRPWLGPITFHMGVDGISMPFVLLTAFLMPLCILASWDAITTRVKEYMIAFLVLETLMLGVFTSLDLVLFYLFFEGGLIPMFLIIGVWGGARRVYASFKFFLYTLRGLAADAARHHGDLLGGGHHRHPPAAHACISRRACRPGCGSPSSPPSR